MTDIGLWAIAEATPDLTAVIEPNGRAVSYAELAALADRYGRGLQALGLRPGATVAGQLPNSTRGMFTVGDIGYVDADGYLYLCDRQSDMIISGGVNIYPAEIEAELSGHPAVDDVAVFGIPHQDWGEEIKAVVQPAPGARPGPALTADLLAFLADRVAKFKLPQDHRLRRGTAARPQRQALQAPPRSPTRSSGGSIPS